MYFPLFSKFFTGSLKIYELPKICNKISKYCQTLVLTIINYQVNFISNFLNFSPFNFYENVPQGTRDCFGSFLRMKWWKSPFLLHQMFSLCKNHMYWRSLQEIIQIWDTWKSVMWLQVRTFKNYQIFVVKKI